MHEITLPNFPVTLQKVTDLITSNPENLLYKIGPCVRSYENVYNTFTTLALSALKRINLPSMLYSSTPIHSSKFLTNDNAKNQHSVNLTRNFFWGKSKV